MSSSRNFTEYNSTLKNQWGAVPRVTGNVSRVASAAWSTMQTVVVVIGVVAGVGALLVAAAGLVVAAVTTFNLNTYYYGQIGALTSAVLDPAGPLFVNTTSGTVYLDCTPGDPFSLCAYTTYINDSFTVLNAFMNNGTLENVTLASLAYTNPAPFMANATNGQLAIDTLVTEAGVLQAQLDALHDGIGSTYYVETPAKGGADVAGCGRDILQPCATLDYVVTILSTYNYLEPVIAHFGTGVFTSSSLVTLPCNVILYGEESGTTLVWNGGLTFNPSTASAGRCYLSFEYFHAAGPITLSAVGSGITDYRVYYKNVSLIDSGSLDIRGNGGFTQLVLETVSCSGFSSVYIQDMYINSFGTVSFNIGSVVQIVDLLRSGFSILRGWEVGYGGLLFNATSAGTTYYFIFNLNNYQAAQWLTCTGASAAMVINGDTSIGVQNFNNTSGPIEVCGAGPRTIVPEIGATGMFVIPNAADSPNFANVTRTTVQAITTDNAHRIALQEAKTAVLEAPTSRTFYVSKTYGNDGTCDATKLKPCNTLSKTLQFYPNATSEFAQNTILFDNGLYAETNYISIPPNAIFSGNEIGTLLIFGAGAGLHPTAWSYTGIGYTTFLRFGLIRCAGAPCAFTTADVAPPVPIFATFIFYNCSLHAVTPFSFTKMYVLGNYFGLSMESVIVSGLPFVLQDITQIDWSLSGDIYAPIQINYNNSFTYGGIDTTVKMNGLIPHASISVNNYFSSLIVDWSIHNVVMRDAATLSRYAVSGAFVNAHGDVLSLGTINGGLNTVGGGSTEYLTKAPGLGYTPTTPSDWSPAPTTQQEANDQLASRMEVAENAILPQRYLVTGITGGAAYNTPSVCYFDVNLNVGTSYVQGASIFSPSGGSAVVYNGSTTDGFLFSFDGTITYSQSATSEVSIIMLSELFVNAVLTSQSIQQVSILSSASLNVGFTKVLTLPAAASVTMTVRFSAGLTTTFTTCGLAAVTEVPYYSLSQYT